MQGWHSCFCLQAYAAPCTTTVLTLARGGVCKGMHAQRSAPIFFSSTSWCFWVPSLSTVPPNRLKWTVIFVVPAAHTYSVSHSGCLTTRQSLQSLIRQPGGLAAARLLGLAQVLTCSVYEAEDLVRSKDVQRVVPGPSILFQSHAGMLGQPPRAGGLLQERTPHLKSVIDTRPDWQMRFSRSYARSRSSRRPMS